MPAADDPASALLNEWFEAQRQLWAAWQRTLTGDSDAGREDGRADGAGRADTAADAWQELAARAIGMWSEQLSAVSKAAGEFLATGADRAADLAAFWTEAWSPGTGRPDWTRAASAYADHLSGLLAGIRPPAPGGHDPTRSFVDLYWDAWERTAGRFLEAPSVGHTRELAQAFATATRAWADFRRAGHEYQLIVAEAWGQAWLAFLEAVPGHPPGSMRDLLQLWGTTADQVLIDVFGSERYARAQGRLVNSAMAYRMAERRVADLFLQMSHMPSRSELEEANSNIHELRRELRRLRREVKGS